MGILSFNLVIRFGRREGKESDRGQGAAGSGLSPSKAFPSDAFFSANCDLLLEKHFGELPPDRLREVGLPEHLF